MKVVHVIGGGERGGSKAHLLALCRGLRRRGAVRCEIVCFLEGPVAAAAREHRIGVEVLPMASIADLRAVFRLRRYLRRTAPAIVHTHGLRAGFVGRLAARGCPCAVVSTIHSSIYSDYPSFLKRALYPAIEKLTRGTVDTFIAVSESLGRELVRDGVPPERVTVVANGLPPAPRGCLPEGTGRAGGRPLVLAVGRLEPVKGLETLLEVLSLLASRTAFQALIAGEGSQRRRLEERARALGLEDRVAFLGFRNDVGALMRRADVLVSTSRMEGTPMVLLEAMAAGLPVVVSEVGGQGELVREAGNGFAVSRDDVRRFADRIELLLREEPLRRTLARRGTAALARHFSLDAFVAGTWEVYRRAAPPVPDPARPASRGRVTIAGYFGAGNTGDEAILAGMLRSLRELGIRDVTVLSRDPEATRRLHGAASLPIGRRLRGLWRLFAHLRNADLFLLGGGGLLQDRSRRVVPFWLSRVLLALAAGVPVMYYGLGVGPLTTALGRFLAGAVSNRARAVTVRDAASKALLEAVGAHRPAIEVTADPALCLEPAKTAARSLPAGLPRADGTLTIAVCVRPWPGFGELVDPLAEVLGALRRTRAVSFLLVPLQDPGDRAVSERLLRRLAPVALPDASRVLAPGLRPEEIAAILSACDGVVAMRLHGCVLAALSGVPVFGVVYDPKVSAFLKRAASGEHAASLEELRDRPGEVAAKLVRWLEGRGDQRRRMRPEVDRMIAAAARSARIASRLLTGAGAGAGEGRPG